MSAWAGVPRGAKRFSRFKQLVAEAADSSATAPVGRLARAKWRPTSGAALVKRSQLSARPARQIYKSRAGLLRLVCSAHSRRTLSHDLEQAGQRPREAQTSLLSCDGRQAAGEKMTMLSCSEAIEQLGGSALTSSVSSVAAAVEIEVCARNTFSRLAQGGKMGADGRSCAFFHGDRYLAGRLVARHDRHREELDPPARTRREMGCAH